MKSNKRRKKKHNLWLGIVAVAILAGIAWASLRTTNNEDSVTRVATLSPALFKGDSRTMEAYQAALDVPEVLEQLPCYCGCMTSFGHKNNLFCFKDEHGSACTICQDIALDARHMHKDGFSIDRIKEAIREKYSKYAP